MITETSPGKLTNLQLELLKLFSYQISEQDLLNVKDLLAQYFANKATQEMDDFWETQHLDETTMDQWLAEHHRTPYAS